MTVRNDAQKIPARLGAAHLVRERLTRGCVSARGVTRLRSERADEAGTTRARRTDNSIDVLIVGAGPTGLTLAAQLSMFGLRFRIVDRAPTDLGCFNVPPAAP